MSHLVQSVLARDSRYSRKSYEFVQEAVNLALKDKRKLFGDRAELCPREACEACAGHASVQFGLLAELVTRMLGIRSSHDIGCIIGNLVEMRIYQWSAQDSSANYDTALDWQTALEQLSRFSAMDIDFDGRQPEL